MWNCDDETPLESPRLLPAPRPIRPALKGERGSTYYQQITRERTKHASAEAAEQEFGWAGNAGAYRQDDTEPYSAQISPQQPGLGLFNTSKDHPGLTIKALIDSKDVQRPGRNEQYSPSIASERARHMSLVAKLRRLFACLHWRHHTEALSTTPTTPPRIRDTEIDRKEFRELREAFLAKRQARGSIMYNRETGIAQIPLYSAPDMAQVSQAPALSSFAPRPPLHDSSSTAPTKTVAHAAATVTGDGRVVVIKRQKGFERGKARYSTWLKL